MEHHHHHEHVEEHFSAGDTVRDLVIGMSDGLTVPFALAAGISGAGVTAHVVVLAGLAEIAAGSIAMGLGGFLAAKGDAEHYQSELLREEREVRDVPHIEEAEIIEIFEQYGVTKEESSPVMEALKRNPKAWVDFMMKFELGLEKPEPGRALQSALTIGGAYIVGGLIPLFPYMMLSTAASALGWSAGITLLALAIFGFVKGRIQGVSAIKSAMQTTLVGGAAAFVAFMLAKALS
jgi:VIT1/CCC1 family predicted Fe2+/Mn2+ transporter